MQLTLGWSCAGKTLGAGSLPHRCARVRDGHHDALLRVHALVVGRAVADFCTAGAALVRHDELAQVLLERVRGSVADSGGGGHVGESVKWSAWEYDFIGTYRRVIACVLQQDHKAQTRMIDRVMLTVCHQVHTIDDSSGQC